MTGDELYAIYLSSFPEGANPVFRDPGECAECKREERENLPRGSILVESDIHQARIEMSQRDEKIAEQKKRKKIKHDKAS